MALSATVFKVDLGVSDVDHGYYADHSLTVARHPSETDERMVVRLLAFGLRAHRLSDVDGELTFGPGLSTPGVPDLRLADFTGRILEWIAVGQPDDRVLGKAAGQADRVVLLPFAAGVATWWRTVGPKVAGLPNLSVLQIPHQPVQQLAQTVDRRVTGQVVVIEGQVTMTVGDVDVTFTPEPLM
ncbi:YaeQ family protein [Mycobacterium sp. C3-094]